VQGDVADLVDRVRYLERVIQRYADNVGLNEGIASQNLAKNGTQQRPLHPLMAAADVSSHSSEFAGVESENFCIKPLKNNMTR
jgi:hypothetical protein